MQVMRLALLVSTLVCGCSGGGAAQAGAVAEPRPRASREATRVLPVDAEDDVDRVTILAARGP